MTLLCIYWAFGEPALVFIAILVPFLAVTFGRSARNARPAANSDSTSRLLSREELLAWLRGAMAERSGQVGQFAVLTLVIDEMDAMEARFGREIRRSVGREIARRLQEVLRQEDAVSTLDDNIIAFGLRNVRPPETENLLRLARRLQSICDEPFSEQSARVYCTISIGIAAEVHVAEPSAVALVQAAERAGDFAASSGTGSVRVFTQGLASEKEDDRRRSRALSDALETGEIFA